MLMPCHQYEGSSFCFLSCCLGNVLIHYYSPTRPLLSLPLSFSLSVPSPIHQIQLLCARRWNLIGKAADTLLTNELEKGEEEVVPCGHISLSCSSRNCYRRHNYGLPDCDRWRIPSWAFSHLVARCNLSSVTGLREGSLDWTGSGLSSCNADWIVFVFVRISAAVW